MGIRGKTNCVFATDTWGQSFIFYSLWLLQGASPLTHISARAFMAALNDDSQSLVTFSLSLSPSAFHPPVPAIISWVIFHLEAVLHLPQPCLADVSLLRPLSPARNLSPFFHISQKLRPPLCRDKLLSQPSPPHPQERHTLRASSFRTLFLGWAAFSSSPPPPPLLSGKNQCSPCLQPWDTDFLLREQPQRLPLTAAVPDTLAPRHTLHVHKNTTPGLCFLLWKSSSARAAAALRKYL